MCENLFYTSISTLSAQDHVVDCGDVGTGDGSVAVYVAIHEARGNVIEPSAFMVVDCPPPPAVMFTSKMVRAQ